jgi:hypothetical protein
MKAARNISGLRKSIKRDPCSESSAVALLVGTLLKVGIQALLRNLTQ